MRINHHPYCWPISKEDPLGLYYGTIPRGYCIVIFRRTPPHHGYKFLARSAICGLDKEESPDGIYLAYFPFGLKIERPETTPYHEKLLELDLVTNVLTKVNILLATLSV